MTGYILAGGILLVGIVIAIISWQRKKIKAQNETIEDQEITISTQRETIDQKEHMIHAMQDVMQKEGKIEREADAEHKNINKVNNSSDAVELFNKL